MNTLASTGSLFRHHHCTNVWPHLQATITCPLTASGKYHPLLARYRVATSQLGRLTLVSRLYALSIHRLSKAVTLPCFRSNAHNARAQSLRIMRNVAH